MAVDQAPADPQRPGKTARKSESTESPLLEAVHWTHLINDVLETVAPKLHRALKTFLIALPPIILKTVYGGQFSSWWQLFVLTSPLTIAIAVIITVWDREYLGSSSWVYFLFSGGILTGAAFVSNWSGIGTAPHIPGFPLASPMAPAVAYYNLYHGLAFFTSVGTGILLAYLSPKR